MDSIPAPNPCSPVTVSRDDDDDYVQVPLSAESRAMLEAGIRSAKKCPEGISRGSFAQYADDDE